MPRSLRPGSPAQDNENNENNEKTTIAVPNPENIRGKGNRFSTTNQPANPGRKPSLYNHLRQLLGTEAEAELSREDYYRLIGCLLERPLGDLKTLATDKKTPVWVVSVVRAIVKDAQAGRMNTLDSLLDRLFGKASQPLTGKDQTPLFEAMTDEELDRRIRELQNKVL